MGTEQTRDRAAEALRGVFESSMTDLISYRYVGCSSQLLDRYHAEGRMRIRRDMRTTGGALLTAPLAIAMLDSAGINIDPYYHAACTHIDVHLWEAGREVAEVRVEGTVAREARSAVFTEAKFFDADRPEHLLGVGTVDWSIIGPTPPGFVYKVPGPVPDSPSLPLATAYEAERLDDGSYVVAGLSTRVGADVLHHGPILVSSEAAALDAIAVASRTPDLDIQTSSIRLLSAGRSGPFVTTAEVIGHAGATFACRTEMKDRGAGDRLVATGFVRAQAS